VRLVPDAIRGLLGRSPVVTQAVRLDYQTQLGPEEVDPEPVNHALCLRWWQPGSTRDRQEAALEFRVGEDERVAVEQVANTPTPR
jgi:hypothetical protein